MYKGVVLYPPTLDWNFMVQRPQQIMKQFANNGWCVFFCNQTQNKSSDWLEKINENLFICNDFELLLTKLAKVDILYISWAKHHNIVDKIKPNLVIYDKVDDFEEWEAYDLKMNKAADIMFTTSNTLYENNDHKSKFLIRNACDYEHFQQKKFSPLLGIDKFKKPILGFIGAIGNWVDVDLLERIAKKYTVFVVGPEFGNRKPKNCIYYGIKNYAEINNFYRSIDIGIIPFKINRVSLSANPIKMYEYLASGKPVIATETPETKLFPEHVHIFNKDNFEEVIQNIVENENDDIIEKRKLLAKENSWEIRFKEMEKIILQRLNKE